MGKIEDAIKKINDEVQKNHNDTNLVHVGEYIIDCITTEKAAEKILTEKKNIAGCMQEIRNKAKKQSYGGMAMIRHETVYGWVREYFGLEAIDQKPHLEVVKTQTPAEAPKKSSHLSMDDFGF